MKKSLYALLMVSLMMLVGCNKKEEVSLVQSDLVGTWQLESATMNGEKVDVSLLGIGEYVFNADGTYTSRVTSFTEGTESGTYEVKNDELHFHATIVYGGQTMTNSYVYKINELTDSKLVISIDADVPLENGKTEKISQVMTFKKVK